MVDSFRTVLIGGENARRAAFKIGEFDHLCGLPFSVAGFVNPNASEKFQLVNCGWEWFDLPVYKDARRAVTSDQSIDSAVLYMNAKYVLEWVKELARIPQVKNVVIFAEDVPERDAREICHLSLVTGKNIIGPSSTGMVAAGKGRLGEIGGDWKNLNLCHLDKPGNVGLITKSGGLAGELIWVVSQHSSGISTAVQIGGDAFPATDYVHWLKKFMKDGQTKEIVMAGEAGGDLEERVASWYKTTNYELRTTNPPFKLIAVVSGRFLEQMPKGQKFGHAGAKQEESGFGSAKHKIEALANAGIEVVPFEELGKVLKDLTKE